MASRLETYALSVIAAPGRPGLLAGLTRGFLSACAGLYDIGLEAYLLAERGGLRRRTALPVPVFSVGNLTVGGTGKTPMTQWLCRRLLSRGVRVAVLSRGHGGTGGGVCVVSDKKEVLVDAAEAGDEPVLLARTLPGVPVLTGKDRRLSGREALRRFALDALLLDDGFQYWQLARTLDMVLLDASRPFDNGYPLPRGLLREPQRHLRRAGIVVATRADRLDAAGRMALTDRVAALAPDARLFFATHEATGVVSAADLTADPHPLLWLQGRRVVALCGIAQPQSFVETLKRAHARVAASLVYDDHAAYNLSDVRRAEAALRQTGAEALVMTEKDAVKWPASDEQSRTYALRIDMKVENEQELMDAITTRLFRPPCP